MRISNDFSSEASGYDSIENNVIDEKDFQRCFSNFSMQTYVMGNQQKRLRLFLMSTHRLK